MVAGPSPVRCERGFSLIELMIVVTMMGLILTFSVPAFQSMRRTQNLRGATNGIAGQLRLARAATISTGTSRVFCFAEDSAGYDYHIHEPDGRILGWSFPSGVHYAWASDSTSRVVMQTNGRASTSVNVVLNNDQGLRDSVSLQVSGYLLVH